jgi:hypothetical protein
VTYARDVYIGVVPPDSVNITRIDEVITKIETFDGSLSGKLDEAITELNAIKVGTGFVTGVDLMEVER